MNEDEKDVMTSEEYHRTLFGDANALPSWYLPLVEDTEGMITIYRGVRFGQKEINPLDHVTTDPVRAKGYSKGDKSNIIEMRVPKEHIFHTGPKGMWSTNEFIYAPPGTDPGKSHIGIRSEGSEIPIEKTLAENIPIKYEDYLASKSGISYETLHGEPFTEDTEGELSPVKYKDVKNSKGLKRLF